MRAVTLPQPHATLIALGVQTIHTSTRRAPSSVVGERIAIHAGAKKPRSWSQEAVRSLPVPMKWGGDRHEPGEGLTIEEHAPLPVGFHEYKTWLPLGAVVATARLTACLPIVGSAESDHLCGPLSTPHDPNEWIEAARPQDLTYHYFDGSLSSEDTDSSISDQGPFADFSPGRWAWMLDDPQPLDEPVPAKGRPGLWEWEAER